MSAFPLLDERVPPDPDVDPSAPPEGERADYLAATRAWANEVMVPEMKRRLKLLAYCSQTLKRQAIVRRHCAQDVVTWANDWAWAFDPRLLEDGLPAWVPVVLFPRQVELLEWVNACASDGKNGLVEKSRDVGASLVFCIVGVHRWQTVRGFKMAFGSRVLELADKLGDADSLLEKCRNLIRGEPKWFWPFDPDNPNNTFNPERDLQHKLLLNRVLLSSIKAEGGDEIGRGGRQTLRMLDEFATIARPEKVNGATATGQRALFRVSTPGQPGDAFYQERYRGGSRIFTLRWQDDPRKDQAWRDEQDRLLGPVVARRELDLDYTAGADDVAIPAEWVRVAAVPVETMPRELGRRRCGLDVAEHGEAESVWCGREGPSLLALDGWRGKNTTQTALRAARRTAAFSGESLAFDAVGVGAGVTGTLESADRGWPFEVFPIRSGARPEPGAVDDAPGLTNDVRFLNWRAWATWSLRRRFEKRYETACGIHLWPLEEQVFIPDDDPDLVAQLSALKWEFTSEGKVKLESKKAAAGRGVVRLDRFDAMVLCYAETSVGLLI